MSTNSRSNTAVNDPGEQEAAPQVPALDTDALRVRMQLLLVLADLAAVAIALGLGFFLYGLRPDAHNIIIVVAFLTLAPAWLVALFMGGQYTLRPPRATIVWAHQAGHAAVQGALAGIGLTFLISHELLAGRVFYLLATAFAGILFFAIRMIAVRYGPAPVVRERVLVVGTGSRSQSLIEALNNGRNPNRAELIGAVHAGQDDSVAGLACPHLGDLSDCARLIREQAINHVVMTPVPPLTRELTKFAAQCEARGIWVQGMENAFETLTWRVPILTADESWTATLQGHSASKYATRFKRMGDLALAILLMPLTILIIGACGLLIKLLSPGPVFYHQERIGKDGVPFTFTKLRTMVVDAEKNTGPVWAAADDPRITPIGNLMRKTRVDELPQLFSVLKGDMSIIGPRPEREHFVSMFKEKIPLYEMRLIVPPGITGWAQIHHKYDENTEDVIEKLRYDLYYVRNVSFGLDMQIVYRTFGVMLGKKGAH